VPPTLLHNAVTLTALTSLCEFTYRLTSHLLTGKSFYWKPDGLDFVKTDNQLSDCCSGVLFFQTLVRGFHWPSLTVTEYLDYFSPSMHLFYVYMSFIFL